jgi:hypothetical protein
VASYLLDSYIGPIVLLVFMVQEAHPERIDMAPTQKGLVKFWLRDKQVEYVDLYTNIFPNEAGQIISKLDDWGTTVLGLEGTIIKVPTQAETG